MLTAFAGDTSAGDPSFSHVSLSSFMIAASLRAVLAILLDDVLSDESSLSSSPSMMSLRSMSSFAHSATSFLEVLSCSSSASISLRSTPRSFAPSESAAYASSSCLSLLWRNVRDSASWARRSVTSVSLSSSEALSCAALRLSMLSSSFAVCSLAFCCFRSLRLTCKAARSTRTSFCSSMVVISRDPLGTVAGGRFGGSVGDCAMSVDDAPLSVVLEAAAAAAAAARALACAS
mmetsp:Transcript_1393/g.3330  ORF Transcript_1393/g.3330 Transcript_1393/m.3330 type:complete len:233 (+) Transcript_1393:294-992(+)